MKASTLLLLAQLASVSGETAVVEVGFLDGLSFGDEGAVFYQLVISGQERRVDIGSARVVAIEADQATVELRANREVENGFYVEFSLPGERRLSSRQLLEWLEDDPGTTLAAAMSRWSAEDSADQAALKRFVSDRLRSSATPAPAALGRVVEAPEPRAVEPSKPPAVETTPSPAPQPAQPVPQPAPQPAPEPALEPPVVEPQPAQTAPQPAPEPAVSKPEVPKPEPKAPARSSAPKPAARSEGQAKREIRSFLFRWTRSWERADVPAFLDMYADSFELPDGRSRSDWESQVRRRLESQGDVKVALSAVEIDYRAPIKATATFSQELISPSGSRSSVKMLDLRLGEDGRWRIWRERVKAR